MDTKELIIKLSSEIGVSGHEHALSHRVKGLFEKHCAFAEVDQAGNVYGFLSTNTTANTLMIEAHIDEIGLMVSEVHKTGRIHFVAIGGIDTAILPGSEVYVNGSTQLYGVIGAKPPHLLDKDEGDKPYEIKELYIDVGLSYDEIVKSVSIGNVVSFKAKPSILNNNMICGKSLDNRIGVAILLKCAQRLKGKNVGLNIILAATVQEEVGLRGATMASYKLHPDSAVVIDVTHGITPLVGEDEGFKLGSGTAIAVGPNIDKKMSDALIQTAGDNKIPYTIEVCAGDSGTNAWAIQVRCGGIPSALLSVPLKHMHTYTEIADSNDIESVIDLLCSFCERGALC